MKYNVIVWLLIPCLAFSQLNFQDYDFKFDSYSDYQIKKSRDGVTNLIRKAVIEYKKEPRYFDYKSENIENYEINEIYFDQKVKIEILNKTTNLKFSKVFSLPNQKISYDKYLDVYLREMRREFETTEKYRTFVSDLISSSNFSYDSFIADYDCGNISNFVLSKKAILLSCSHIGERKYSVTFTSFGSNNAKSTIYNWANKRWPSDGEFYNWKKSRVKSSLEYTRYEKDWTYFKQKLKDSRGEYIFTKKVDKEKKLIEEAKNNIINNYKKLFESTLISLGYDNEHKKYPYEKFKVTRYEPMYKNEYASKIGIRKLYVFSVHNTVTGDFVKGTIDLNPDFNHYIIQYEKYSILNINYSGRRSIYSEERLKSHNALTLAPAKKIKQKQKKNFDYKKPPKIINGCPPKREDYKSFGDFLNARRACNET